MPKAVEVAPFERVWRVVRRIPRGKMATYGQVSQLIERRLTPVGVGWAIRAAKEASWITRHALTKVAQGSIPWQRVVNARGGISTDNEHPGLQRTMLESEGVRFERDGSIDLARHGWRPRARG